MEGTAGRSWREVTFAPTIFHQTWWLDIASGGSWSRVTHTENDKVVGWLPYFKGSRLGLPVSRMPYGTPFLGPAICPEAENDLRAQMRIMRSLARQIPPFFCFVQKMHRGVQNLLPFQMEGFSTGVQFSYEISGDPDAAWRNMRRRTREVISSAGRSLVLDPHLEVRHFLDFCEKNHSAKFGSATKYARMSHNLAAAAFERGQGSLAGARNSDGKLLAAIMTVFDHSTTYYFLSSRTQDAGNAAVSFLLWSAIRCALKRGTIFDFNGVADAGSAAFFSGFSTHSTPRYTIAKSTLTFRLAREARRLALSPDNLFTDCM